MADSAVADVVVVGAGPSGAVVTHTLAERGLKVVCLEQGDWVNPTDFPANNAQWELQIQDQWAHDPNVRKLPSDYPVGVSDSDMHPVMFNAVGGSSIYYGAEWPRLLPSDFRVRTLDGVADDWPITYEDMVRYYDAVDRFIGVSGLDGDTAYPPGLEYPLPPHPLGKAGRKAAEAANKLGWHWWPGTNAIPSQKFKELAQCARWGTCEWGCPESSKASFDVAYWPHALRSGATLITGARVRHVETGANGRATGVVWLDRDGREHLQRANAVVLCANGIGTARTLLLSASPAHPDGLANSSGLVGKNLMLHPNCSVTGYYDDDLESWRGPAGQLIHSLEFYDTRAEHDFVRGVKMHALPTPGPLNAVETQRELGYDAMWGKNFLDIASSHARGILWAANTEDLPDESNFVSLDPDLTDDSGIPAPAVHYRISENTRKLLKFAVARMEELHAAVDAKHTIAVELWVDQPGHLLGTARMGENPKTSVVNSFGQAHDVDNLFIADGSIFVTSGSANPTCTIAALALRVGQHIADTAKNREAVA
ncbi:GMC family oxidoreductase [Saccharopolyspora sp. ASAGF58]|uniref:GMC family oxidoreductase n=1 Tax=Saccharopolyspora sp. ASAGF58 TaxID=2719023 RepID=UPI00143FBD79|nr:GMC family oxidoreductase [Saccharopolyspora sp. ASAGF58]QIZ37782.1 GMC family oxidoreductase [Saccharopolyspora sp. ASAGF58]